MKTIVLDTNELTKDFMLSGLKYQLFEHMFHRTWVTVNVPSTVLEELVANHARAVASVDADLVQLNRRRKNLGLAPLVAPQPFPSYRDYITERFEERLSFNILAWPSTPHRSLVARAVARTPPFDARGGGYRDALVWADVVELVRSGLDVVLVSMDNAFAGDDGALAPQLQAEVAALAGSVVLVRDFNHWLLGALPWEEVSDLESAVTLSRTSEFYEYYLTSDFQDDLRPSVRDLGFGVPPYSLIIEEVVWDGALEPIAGASMEDGLKLIEFELGQQVGFTGVFPLGVNVEPGWSVSDPDLFRRVTVEGSVAMTLRIGVLFGGEVGFSIDALSWHRADGAEPGASLLPGGIDPDQTPLF